jgi:hypothetical protein
MTDKPLVKLFIKEKGLLPADLGNFLGDGGKPSSLLPGKPQHDALKSEQAVKFIYLFCWDFGGGAPNSSSASNEGANTLST